ncbi:uncharacterized protein LOC108733202 [Agrilus planipennis]|uniref:Uncharacterized protein LOC108733202 n=1 Tax=Agrilus planipennis TaxID=224129 RepID=A0A1W4W6R6_AGRPL|nr:uncharacterized protein LOC108733202 [Agrilus planipennis]XP_018319796.1 uncharacterized protein LOC108733202 [Agrilus planipennis]
MKTYKINDLETIARTFLKPCQKFKNYEAVSLTSNGENYGSLVLDVKIFIENEETCKDEVLNVVAKMLPPNEFLKEAFNVNITFKKEVHMYSTIMNELKLFAKEHDYKESLEFLAEYFGSRVSLNPNAVDVNDDAIIILENLKLSEFVSVSRFSGFDLEASKLILKTLAQFHGIPLSLKLLYPDRFENKLMKYLEPGMDFEKEREYIDCLFRRQLDIAAEFDKRCEKLISRFLKLLNDAEGMFDKNCSLGDSYGTICHIDLWINNIMLKYDKDKMTPKKCKFVDFQIYCYGNLTRDVVFFLFTSTHISVLREHFDELVEIYRNQLCNILQHFNCDTKPYRSEGFREQMKIIAKATEIVHASTMLNVIHAEKGEVKDMEEIEPDDFLQERHSEIYKQRLAAIFNICSDKQWV